MTDSRNNFRKTGSISPYTAKPATSMVNIQIGEESSFKHKDGNYLSLTRFIRIHNNISQANYNP